MCRELLQGHAWRGKAPGLNDGYGGQALYPDPFLGAIFTPLHNLALANYLEFNTTQFRFVFLADGMLAVWHFQFSGNTTQFSREVAQAVIRKHSYDHANIGKATCNFDGSNNIAARRDATENTLLTCQA